MSVDYVWDDAHAIAKALRGKLVNVNFERCSEQALSMDVGDRSFY